MSAATTRGLLAQTRMELALTFRRGENVLITVIVPIVLLVFFASLGLNGGSTPLDYLVPGILSLAIISTGMVNLGIATGYERYYGVLKRLGGSPLPRWELLLAKAAGVLVLEIFQVLVLLAVAGFGYGWWPRIAQGAAIVGLVLGTVAFSAIGLAMAGALRAEATLAIANGLYLLFLLFGNVLVPIEQLPPLIQPISTILPATALSDTLRFAFTSSGPFPLGSFVILAIWAGLALLVAIRTFQWE